MYLSIDQHASIAPSGLKRLCKCAGSLKACEGVNSDTQSTEDAELGNTAHAVCAAALSKQPLPESPLIDNEMLAHVKMYVDFCKSLGGVARVEQRVEIPIIHPTLCWGTFDYDSLHETVLHVVDFKYGFKYVNVNGCEQMIAYGGGILAELDQATFDKITHIHIHIVQPRPFHPEGTIRTQILTKHELMTELGRIRDCVTVALSDNPPLVSGPQCYRCPRLHDCPAATEASYNAIDVVSSYSALREMDNARLGNDLIALTRAQEMMKERIISLTEILNHKIKQGEQSPTHELATMYGDRAWSKTEKEVLLEGTLAGVNLQETTLMSPAKAEKAGLSKTTTKSMVTQKSYSKLKPIDFDKVTRKFKS